MYQLVCVTVSSESLESLFLHCQCLSLVCEGESKLCDLYNVLVEKEKMFLSFHLIK